MSTMATGEARPERGDVLRRLAEVCASNGVEPLAGRLGILLESLSGDLDEIEHGIQVVDSTIETPVHRSMRHLLLLKGKRLRPLCVTLAANLGTGSSHAVRELAIAVELVHQATLLHDDVVDMGERRRGAEAARVIYGNAASIFGGDWLLIEALRRVHRAGSPDVLARLLAVLGEMVTAEAWQLAGRGKLRGGVDEYLRVAEGKTASLFRWALFAGGRAGGVSIGGCRALEAFGGALGLAFQVVDDVLDVSGDPRVTGKGVFADLREGKLTYPLLLAVERSPGLRATLERAIGASDVGLDPAHAEEIAAALRETGAIDDALAFADSLSVRAIASLADAPSGGARDVLEWIGRSLVQRPA